MSVRIALLKDHNYGPYDDDSGGLAEIYEAPTLEEAISRAAADAHPYPQGQWDTTPRLFVLAEELTADTRFLSEIERHRLAIRLETDRLRQEEATRQQRDRLERLRQELSTLLAPEDEISKLRARIAEVEELLADG